MAFNENLQNLRKMKGMSQEQLAEQLGVSRQAISKYESGNGYPETEKLIAICEIFDCSMDVLIKGKITADSTGEKKKYENLQNKFSKGIALGVGIILLGVTILLGFAGVANAATTAALEERYAIMGVIVLLCCILIAVPTFIMLGIEEENFDKKITAKDAAEECFLSESHSRMLFSKHFKVPPAKYINDLKIKKATSLLKSGLYSIVEVSKMVGIDSPSYFSWFYKKHTSLNPSDVMGRGDTSVN